MGVLSVFLWMQDLNGVVFRILIGIFWVVLFLYLGMSSFFRYHSHLKISYY
ncbi:hypothetical protein [uncultured Gammaproteobacteria bacterium]|nr:hypothetical protein [uncultured Gammaproteobacteria bacterium]